MGERKPLSKKARFEVFKRDKFTCQYCGAKAPDVVLQVDHIEPVAKGGTDDLLNLITSCASCNNGKGARTLSDDSVVARQRDQVAELQERREQLEMMLQWRDDLSRFNEEQVDAIAEYIAGKSKWQPNDNAKRQIEKWVRKHTIGELFEAIDDSFSQYLEWVEGDATIQSWSKAFEYVPRIAHVKRQRDTDPFLQPALYIRGICRNRFSYVNEREALDLILAALRKGYREEELKRVARFARNWTQWGAEMDSLLEDE